MAKAINAQKNPPVTQKKSPKERFFQGQHTIHSDLFKLEVAEVQKNMGIDSPHHEPDYVGIPHTHFFHTFDSDGRKQTRSIAIAGHYHVMTETADPDGGPPSVSCGPAVKEVRKRVQGKFVKGEEPLKDDDHVHEITYLKSCKVEKRVANAEAANLIANESQKTAPIPGVLG